MPRVSIGLPVYNGARYLEASIESLLGQTWQDFELIISDNASTDDTERICRRFQERDARVHYLRNDQNRGGAWNFNRVADLATAEYFTWAAHDDVRAPENIARCAEVLDRDPSVILAYTSGAFIDEDGEHIRNFYPETDLNRTSARERLQRWFFEPHIPYHSFFGLIRTSALRRTPLLANCAANDEILLTHLVLLGKFQVVPEPLFLNRDHSQRASRTKDAEELAVWNDPENRGKVPAPISRRIVRQLAALWDAPLSHREKLGCLWLMFRWTGWRSRTALYEMLATTRM